MNELSRLILDRFPKDRRTLASPKFIAGISLPKPYKDFLKEVGCPKNKELNIDFKEMCGNVKRLWECGLIGTRPAAIRGLVCVGINDNDVAFAIEEETGGTLWEVDLKNVLDPVYVNRGIPELARFLAYYRDYCIDYKCWEQDQGEWENVTDFRPRYEVFFKTLIHVDERALERGNWWNWILQEISMEAGL